MPHFSTEEIIEFGWIDVMCSGQPVTVRRIQSRIRENQHTYVAKEMIQRWLAQHNPSALKDETQQGAQPG